MESSPYRAEQTPMPRGMGRRSAADIYLQRHAENKVKELLREGSASGTASAVASSTLRSAAIPMLLTGIMPAALAVGATNNRATQTAYISDFLQQKGMDAKDARRGAKEMYSYLATQSRMPGKEVRDAIADDARGWYLHNYKKPSDIKRLVGSPDEALALLMHTYPSRSEEVLKKELHNFIRRAPPPAALGGSSILPKAVASNFIAKVEKDFLKRKGYSGLVAPLLREHGSNVLRSLGRAAPVTAILALPAGISAYMRSRSKRESLRDLRERYSKANDVGR